MSDVNRALAQVADIRAQLAASTRFRGIAPGLNVATGILALAVACVQSFLPHLLPREGTGYVAVWAAVLIASGVVVGVETLSRARRLHGAMAGALIRSTLGKILPFAAAATVITGVICTLSPETVWALPGLWLILIGLVGFSALSGMPRAIIWAATWYFLTGTLVLALGAWWEAPSPWMMGIPLFVGQCCVAIIFNRASRGSGIRE